jgi:hypothetical protein
MEGIIIICSTFLITTIIVGLIYLRLYRVRIKDKRLITEQEHMLFRAFERKDIQGINEYGRLYLFNRVLTFKQLKVLRKRLNAYPDNTSKLDELRNLVYNKYLDWTQKEYH